MAGWTILRRPLACLPLLVSAALLLSSCGGATNDSSARRGQGGPPTIAYIVARPTSVPIVQDLPARVSAFEVSQVRPQVTGIVQRRYFTEGGLVRRGQTLYQIDSSAYQAQVAQASANLQSARASAEAARALAARYKPLAEIEAVSKQDYTDAVARARQAQAAIAQSQAALQAARINLRYTRVPAPISGRIGISNVTEGALVTANQPEALTTISRLDPVNVDIQQSAAELVALRRSLMTGGAAPASTQVRLKLADGSDYGFSGTVQFSEVIVDQGTGTVTLRARFPNPEAMLLPGMFVTAQLAQAVNTSAFLIPQQAISRDPKGNATLFVVGPGNRASQRTVVAERAQGPNWVVTQGLAANEKVIVQGGANLRDGDRVKASPFKGRPPAPIPKPAAKAAGAKPTG